VAEEQKNESAEEQQQAADENDAVKKKPASGAGSFPNQKLILIILALNTVAILAVAGIVWIGFSKSSQKVTLGDIAAEKEAPHEEKEGAEGGGHGEKSGHGEKGKEEVVDNFVKESFTVNLADSKGSHFAQVTVEIEVDNGFTKAEVDRLRPKIRDFIVVVLSSKTYEQVESVDGRDFLREEIRNKINGYLTRGQIKNVYFTQFIVQ
jgi:flagellar FliL protein